jgi:hypothetical protein
MNGMRRKIAGKTPAQIREMSKDGMKEPVTTEDFLQVSRISNLMRVWVGGAEGADKGAPATPCPASRLAGSRVLAAACCLAHCASLPRPLNPSQAVTKINPSVAQKDVMRHEEWLKVYGSI